MTTAKNPVYKLNNSITEPAFGLGVFHSKPEKTIAAVSSAVAEGYRLIESAINALDAGERGGPYPEKVSPQTFPRIIKD